MSNIHSKGLECFLLQSVSSYYQHLKANNKNNGKLVLGVWQMKHQQTFLLDKTLFSHPLTHSIPSPVFLPLLSLSSTVFGVFLSATWVSLTAPWCGAWWVPGECTPSHPQSFPVCNPWVMAVDACCTTRHGLSDCASAWLAYRFQPTHVSLLSVQYQPAWEPLQAWSCPEMALQPPTHITTFPNAEKLSVSTCAVAFSVLSLQIWELCFP